jgi:hypothetical protein
MSYGIPSKEKSKSLSRPGGVLDGFSIVLHGDGAPFFFFFDLTLRASDQNYFTDQTELEVMSYARRNCL